LCGRADVVQSFGGLGFFDPASPEMRVLGGPTFHQRKKQKGIGCSTSKHNPPILGRQNLFRTATVGLIIKGFLGQSLPNCCPTPYLEIIKKVWGEADTMEYLAPQWGPHEDQEQVSGEILFKH
jgi:hypothetical protein